MAAPMGDLARGAQVARSVIALTARTGRACCAVQLLGRNSGRCVEAQMDNLDSTSPCGEVSARGVHCRGACLLVARCSVMLCSL